MQKGVIVVTVTRMTVNGVRTVVSSINRHIYQLNSCGLVMSMFIMDLTRWATILWESLSVTESSD